MDFDPVKLRTLVAVKRAGSMTAAAASLGYTTGAVSQQMSALERTVGAPLFVQVGRTVQLTDAAQLLVVHAGRMLRAAADAQTALASLAEEVTGEVLIGVFGTAAAALLPACVGAVHTRCPGVTLRSVEVDVDRATSAVATGAVDLAFGVDYPAAPVPRDPGVAVLTVATEQFALAMPPTTAPAPRAVGRWLADCRDDLWILPPESTSYGRAIRQACRGVGFEPRVDHTVTDTASTMALVAAGIGVAPVTALMLTVAARPLHIVPIRDGLERRMVLAHRREPSPQPSVRAVLDSIRTTVSPPQHVAANSSGSGADPSPPTRAARPPDRRR